MSTILSVLASLVLLSILVTVHELGHFLVARKLGFTVLEFSIGMGPAILKKEKNGILYALRAFPIGGMCRFYGEDQEVKDERCFNAHAAWKRILVVAAGPFMNIVLALLFSVITLFAYGNYVPSIYEIEGADAPAYVGGLQTGDIIEKVDGERVLYYSDTVNMIRDTTGETMQMTVLRDGHSVELTLHDVYDAEAGYNRIGITITPVRLRYGLASSLSGSFYYVGGMVRDTFSFFGTLVRGEASSSDVSGPVGTIAYISEAVRYGFETVLRLIVLINVSLAIFNILPLPALDGGRLVFLIIEAIAGKPVNQKVEGSIHFAGLMLLFGLIIFLTYNDIANLFAR